MELRSFYVLSGFVTALGSIACSDGNHDAPGGAGRGGSAGSGEGGAPAQGGSTGLPRPRVGLQLSLHAPSPPIPNTECFPAGVTAIGNPAPALNPLDPGQGALDGVSELSVVCSVTGAGTFSVSATIARDALRFKISDGTIDAATGTGTFELLIDTFEAGDIVTEVDELCTFDVSESPLEVSNGNLFATFECPVLWNHQTATDTACGASGALLLESCQD